MSHNKVGMVLVSDGKSRPQPMRLQLTNNMLILQKEEAISEVPGVIGPPSNTMERIIKIKRQKASGLGLSIKGGAEHKLPVLISRIFKDQAADQTGQLFVGDAILKVNDVMLDKVNHDDAVNTLKSAGDVVFLTVRHHRGILPFLSKAENQLDIITRGQDTVSTGPEDISRCPVNSSDHDEIPRAQNANLRLEKEGDKKFFRFRNNPQCMTVLRPEKTDRHWVDVMTINLLMAYLTRYMLDTDKLRPNAFEIRSEGSKPSAVIHCDDAGMLSEWIKHISNNIYHLTNQQIKMLNKSLPPSEHIFHMGWLTEGCSAPQPWYKWKPKFLCLKGPDLYLFDVPPKSLQDFGNCLCAYRIYQCMMRLLKESEFADDRHNCYLLQTGANDNRYMSGESRADVLRLETAWHRATYHAVTRLGSKTFSVIHEGKTGGLTLDWIMGFALYDTQEKKYAWKFKFSQLKGSSDDGKRQLTLVFYNADNNKTDTKEVECLHLTSLLYCMHAFLTAKLASVDPTFLRHAFQY